MSHHILVVDDDQATCNLLKLGLQRNGSTVTVTTEPELALASLVEQDFDLVLTDLNMPRIDGIELCRRIARERPDLPVVVLTAFGNLDTAIAAIRAGAYDFITKPFELDAVSVAVSRAIAQHELRREVKRLRAVVGATTGFGSLTGSSPTMSRLYPLLERVAQTDTSVFITGESGTGKEVVARSLHERGPRAGGPFVAVNCAALPEGLLEGELFGHERGAFTDAKGARVGLFAQANGGTLFLDEVGDMPVGLQPKILRALESKRVRPLGGAQEVPFDARIIAATNRDVESMVEDGRFREDLYYRLAVITIGLPPLRARGNDVLILAQLFLDQFAREMARPVTGIATSAAKLLLTYPWPGNIRELRNCIERAVALTHFDRISSEDLPEKVKASPSSEPMESQSQSEPLVPLEEVERRYILKVLEASSGNKSLAAETLGLSRKTLYRKLAAWGVSSSD
ncbi:MAG TPA: sigma-54 dependent transcriptional regulator [Polyangiaceae bacterium]|nr:sigma-54 dependent transcriptional regulator [Polyangiaceae bacterium]